MSDGKPARQNLPISERGLAIIVFVLFSSWMLAFSFEGEILSAIAGEYDLDASRMVIGAVGATAVGLLFWGFLIRSQRAAKRAMLCSMVFCLLASAVFFSAPSHLWSVALFAGAFFIAGSITGWSYYLRGSTPKYERIKVIAAGLIF
ncbi:MAG: LuxR family transcriptional regulator, partial [Firmicutes bacterium]|nr:LuxR family transcriptional regulator [Bacillota bacterium]